MINQPTTGMKIEADSEGITINGHIGTWYPIYQCMRDNDRFFILESEVYGDEAEWLYVDEYGNIVDEETEDFIVEECL